MARDSTGCSSGVERSPGMGVALVPSPALGRMTGLKLEGWDWRGWRDGCLSAQWGESFHWEGEEVMEHVGVMLSTV